MDNSILVAVLYTVKEGKRDEFLRLISENKIAESSRNEPGNIKYEYFIPTSGDNEVFLLEKWSNAQAIKEHGATDHYGLLTQLKNAYVLKTEISRYSGQEIEV